MKFSIASAAVALALNAHDAFAAAPGVPRRKLPQANIAAEVARQHAAGHAHADLTVEAIATGTGETKSYHLYEPTPAITEDTKTSTHGGASKKVNANAMATLLVADGKDFVLLLLDIYIHSSFAYSLAKYVLTSFSFLGI